MPVLDSPALVSALETRSGSLCAGEGSMISKVAFSIISLVASGGQGFVFRLKTEADRKDSPRMNTMKRTSHNTEVQSTPILKLLIIKSRKCTCKDSNKSIIYPLQVGRLQDVGCLILKC